MRGHELSHLGIRRADGLRDLLMVFAAGSGDIGHRHRSDLHLFHLQIRKVDLGEALGQLLEPLEPLLVVLFYHLIEHESEVSADWIHSQVGLESPDDLGATAVGSQREERRGSPLLSEVEVGLDRLVGTTLDDFLASRAHRLGIPLPDHAGAHPSRRSLEGVFGLGVHGVPWGPPVEHRKVIDQGEDRGRRRLDVGGLLHVDSARQQQPDARQQHDQDDQRKQELLQHAHGFPQRQGSMDIGMSRDSLPYTAWSPGHKPRPG